MRRFISLPLAATLLNFLLLGSSARAQPAEPARPEQPPPAPAPKITMPNVRVNAAARYPEQALRDGIATSVVVVVILDINADGSVRDAHVETPQGHGFDEEALVAAKQLVFEPARRGDQAIAARIKYRFEFAAPRAVVVGRVSQLKSTNDAPVAGARVTVQSSAGAETTVTTAADGTWRVADLPAGPLLIKVEAPGYETSSTTEQLQAGQEVKLVLRLAPHGAAAVAAARSERSDEDAIEILVQGERPPREVVKRTLEREEIASIPGTNGDALRSIESLPGVARPPPFIGLLIVRGSAPRDTTIFVDGTEIPLVYHFIGLSSVIPTELLEKIDFYPGNYSTAYGRGMGGMVDVGVRDPKSDGLHGMAQLDLVDARLMAEGPVGNTGWNFLVAGRRSWLDLWLGPALRAANYGVTAAPRYYDWQVMAQRKVGKSGSFRLFFFGADDKLEILNRAPEQSNPQFGGTLGYRTSFWRIQARYLDKLDADTELRLTAAGGRDSFDIGLGSDYFTLGLTPFTFRGEVSHSVTRGVKANVGLDLQYTPYDFTLRFPRFPRPGEPGGGPGDLPVETVRSGNAFYPGAYMEWEVVPWRGGRIVPGIRGDYTNVTKSWDVSPRINVRQDLTRGFPRTTLKSGVGVFYQPPYPNETDPVYGNPSQKSSRAIQGDFGFEQEFTRQVELSVDVYYKRLEKLVTFGATGKDEMGDGHAYGVEWLLRYKPDERFFGWIAYTLSRSERRDTPDMPLTLSQFDQTHILTALGRYYLGRGWHIGGRVRYVSGNLYTPQNVGAYDSTTGAAQPAPSYPPFGSRLPAFNQFDARVDKEWTFKDWKLTAYLDVQNVINRKNPEAVSYNYNYTRDTKVNGLPILPILGVRGEF